MQIWSSLQSLLAVFGGGVVVICAIVGAGYGIFRMLGEKWLDARFADRREALKHEQQKELEALRIHIARLIDRAAKLNQREFDVIPQAWAHLNDAFSRTDSIMRTLRVEPDPDKMSAGHLEEFIARSKLAEWEKAELKKSEEKTKYYREQIFWHHLWETQEYATNLSAYVRKNCILIPKEIRASFILLNEMIWDAINEQELSHRYPYISFDLSARDKFFKNGTPIMKTLEEAIEKRLSDLTNTVI
ncbi:hypothetical protein RZS28_16280 [Methylocapsa polymorpha]|uniref:Uncharacterized protein n=1 Tax=Methylocapsa polymorpha TaxID=3080828 RepID=A0ABZ0HPZ2_9HYPH|nr:hypothetical protein RZS28_16280 [Methylocapsa sp. RX1]